MSNPQVPAPPSAGISMQQSGGQATPQTQSMSSQNLNQIVSK